MVTFLNNEHHQSGTEIYISDFLNAKKRHPVTFFSSNNNHKYVAIMVMHIYEFGAW
jgi:hypothetical protein